MAIDCLEDCDVIGAEQTLSIKALGEKGMSDLEQLRREWFFTIDGDGGAAHAVTGGAKSTLTTSTVRTGQRFVGYVNNRPTASGSICQHARWALR